ncbi:hypothetical protein BGX26_002362 [Mortierella sp. AD094]|nr:hypothetical protein BGX26_002362 [Mortierella sp. AD094]
MSSSDQHLLDDVKQAKNNLLSYPLYVSLRTYFDNGGSYCYVCPTDQLTIEVPGLDDVTLIVAAGENLIDQADIFGDNGLCSEGRHRFAILDGPSEGLHSDPHEGMISYPATPYAAAYYPNLTASWATYQDEDGVQTVSIPTSAAVAGAYCSVGRDRGVWKAPANVVLQGGLVPQTVLSDDMQGRYSASDKPLNLIRVFQAGASLIWGARTLAGLGRDIKRAMAFVRFEANSQPTWERVRAAIDAYLHSLWCAGGLMGTKPEEAYFVQVGLGVTMAQDDIDQGRMIIKVGMAPVIPAEFIILEFTEEVTAN